ncbi:MAG: DUF2809 domain-containing protein [Fibrobacterales bacterium]
MSLQMKSSRTTYLIMVISVIVLGLATRIENSILPTIITQYGGDVLWATMVYFGFTFINPKASMGKIVRATLLFSYGIECSQLYHAPIIDAIRNTAMGGLILGFTFVWSDIWCYTLGALIGIGIDVLLIRPYLSSNKR